LGTIEIGRIGQDNSRLQEGGSLTPFRYNRVNPTVSGLTYKIMVSTNLAAWVEDAAAVQSVFATNGDVQTMSVTLGAAWQNETKLFIRVTAQ
jgi:hypothetical protein